MGAVGTQVVQPPQVGLQFPTGQLRLLQQGQVAEDKGIQGGGAAAERKGGMEKGERWSRRKSRPWKGRLWAAGEERTHSSGPGVGKAPQVAPACLEWDSIPGLHKGHIECPTAQQVPPGPGGPPTLLYH